jgi:stigma-specific protein Stig1
MKLIRNAFAASIAVAALAVAACSSHGSNSTGTAGNTNPGQGQIGSLNGTVGNTGTVGAHLTIGTGVNVTALSWTIQGVGANENGYTGTVNIGDAQSVEWVAGGINAGTYTIIVTGSDSSGDPCNGSSASFNVTAGATVQAGLFVTCIVPPDSSFAADVHTGSVEVDASVTLVGTPPVACPGITSLSINPAEQVAGVPAQLNLVTTGPTPVITWTVSPAGDGTFSNVNAANPTFTCTNSTSNPLTITATVANPDSGLCAGQTFTTLSAFFNCESGTLTCAQINPATPNACTGADGGSTCVNFQTDVNNCGSCGHTCTAGTPVCQAGICIAPPPVACTGFTAGANTPAGCVTCPASPNGVCTATEQVIIAHDILKNAQLAGAPKTTSCYSCLVINACLDSSAAAFPAGNGSGIAVTNSECGDPSGAGDNPPFNNVNVSGASAAATAACIDALSCALTSNNTSPASECSLSQAPPSVSNCYCGADTGSTCLSSPAAAIGVCASKIAADIGTTDPTTVLSHFTDTTFSGGGVGLAILNCGLTAPATPPAAAKCPTCFN